MLQVVEELDKISEELPFLECDAMTRVISFLLHEKGILHQPFLGSLTLPMGVIRPHLWIQVGDRYVDYRARKYVLNFFGPDGIEKVPHGVFEPVEFPSSVYFGERVIMVPDRAMYDILVETGKPLPPDFLEQLWPSGGFP